MKIKEVVQTILEAPLPDDWDASIYNDRVPFKTRVDYAKARAEKVGRGSSRVVFAIPYQGRKTVLKLAMNGKGAAQNEAEAQLFEDHYLRQTGLVIPLIDYDERSSYPTWIHTEYAERIKPADIKRYSGGASLSDILLYAAELTHSREKFFGGDSSKVDPENEFVQELTSLYGNYNGHIKFADLAREANWGLYKGHPVIIDLGFTNDVYDSHYKR